MTPQEWQRIKLISAAALERPDAERFTYITRACDGDETLTHEVRSLIESVVRASDLFERPAVASARTALARAISGPQIEPSTRIGPYRVIRELGHGGMGTVFLAERADDEYRQKVALKVASEARSPAALRWLREERQILASLEHPNIARLTDGGTTPDGVPYLVMEYVEGIPIDVYCAEKQLSIRDRLALFHQVCLAVDFAHRNLIVHRDLKPGNILVASGVPKLLDFGIAKLTSESHAAAPGSTLPTGPRMMTPEYASPEQLKGQQITTATDVYALGVVLYRLLTGRMPYRPVSDAPHDLAAAICDQEAARPSLAARSRTMRRELAGDLDTIVLKALKKGPEERYASAAALADDVNRYLTGRPVLARGDTSTYRAKKFLRRHKVAVGAGAVVLLALIGGVSATFWQAREAERQRTRAQRHFDDVRRLASSLIFEVHDGIADLPGSTATRQMLVQRALAYFDGLAAEEHDDPDLQRELAAAYDQLAGVLGRPYASNLGDSRAALASYRKALAIREDLARRSNDRQTQMDLASSYHSVGRLAVQTADTRNGLTLQKRASDTLERLIADSPNDAEVLRAAARTFVTRAHAYEQVGQIADSLDMSRRALSIDQRLLERNPTNDGLRAEIATGHGRVGIALLRMGDVEGAVSHFQQRTALAEHLIAAAPNNVPFQRGRSTAHLQLGQALARRGDVEAAQREMRASLAIRQRIVDYDRSDRQAMIDVMFAQIELGHLLSSTGRHAAAVEQFRPALKAAESLAAADPSYVFYRISLGAVLSRLARSLVALGMSREAARLANRAIELMNTAAAADPTDVRVQFERALAFEAAGDSASASPEVGPDVSPQHSYQQSRDVMTQLRETGRLAGGTLLGGEAQKLAEIERKLAAARR